MCACACVQGCILVSRHEAAPRPYLYIASFDNAASGPGCRPPRLESDSQSYG